MSWGKCHGLGKMKKAKRPPIMVDKFRAIPYLLTYDIGTDKGVFIKGQSHIISINLNDVRILINWLKRAEKWMKEGKNNGKRKQRNCK